MFWDGGAEAPLPRLSKAGGDDGSFAVSVDGYLKIVGAHTQLLSSKPFSGAPVTLTKRSPA
jgi:hypothetical protein